MIKNLGYHKHVDYGLRRSIPHPLASVCCIAGSGPKKLKEFTFIFIFIAHFHGPNSLDSLDHMTCRGMPQHAAYWGIFLEHSPKKLICVIVYQPGNILARNTLKVATAGLLHHHTIISGWSRVLHKILHSELCLQNKKSYIIIKLWPKGWP